MLSTIRQTDDQLSAAEKRIQKAEVLKEEATRKTERERMAREESEKLLEVLKQSQEKEVQEFKEKMKKSLDELTR